MAPPGSSKDVDSEGLTREEIALKELKSKIQDVILEHPQFDDHFYLLQWLKTQKLNVTKAQTMLREAIKWKHDHHFDGDFARELFEPNIEQAVKVHFDGVTKDGIPVLSLQAGSMDFRRIVETRGRDQYVRYWVQVFTQTENLMIESNRRRNEAIARDIGKVKIISNSTTGVVAVIDFHNYSIKQTQSIQTIQSQIAVLKIMSNYYPALLGHIYIINTSKFFQFAFKAVRPFLEGPCLTLEIFDTNEEVWKTVLSQRIDPGQLRPEYGGTKDQTI